MNIEDERHVKSDYEAPGSSWLLQSLFHFDRVFLYTFLGVETVIVIGKLISLPYSGNLWWLECFTVLILYWAFSELRIHAGSSANKLESCCYIIYMILFAAVCIICNGVMMGIQTYVLNVDILLNLIAVVFVALELLVGILTGLFSWRYLE